MIDDDDSNGFIDQIVKNNFNNVAWRNIFIDFHDSTIPILYTRHASTIYCCHFIILIKNL